MGMLAYLMSKKLLKNQLQKAKNLKEPIFKNVGSLFKTKLEEELFYYLDTSPVYKTNKSFPFPWSIRLIKIDIELSLRSEIHEKILNKFEQKHVITPREFINFINTE